MLKLKASEKLFEQKTTGKAFWIKGFPKDYPIINFEVRIFHIFSLHLFQLHMQTLYLPHSSHDRFQLIASCYNIHCRTLFTDLHLLRDELYIKYREICARKHITMGRELFVIFCKKFIGA